MDMMMMMMMMMMADQSNLTVIFKRTCHSLIKFDVSNINDG